MFVSPTTAAATAVFIIFASVHNVPIGYKGVAFYNGKLETAVHSGYTYLSIGHSMVTVPVSEQRITLESVECDTNGTYFVWDNAVVKFSIVDPYTFVKRSESVVVRSYDAAVLQLIEDPVRTYLSAHCSTMSPHHPMQLNLANFSKTVERQTKEKLAWAGISSATFLVNRKPTAPTSSVDEDYARQAQAVAREMAAVAERSAEKAEQVNVRAALDNEISNNRARADADALIQKVKNELAYNETAFKELAHVRVVSELHKMFLNNSEHVLKYFWIKSLTGAEKWMIPHNASIRFDHM